MGLGGRIPINARIAIKTSKPHPMTAKESMKCPNTH
jgi:hypothetical protein